MLEKNWLVNKIVSEALEDSIAANARGRLLDIGCGGKPYEALTRGYVTEHIGLDTPGTSPKGRQPELKSTAYEIPAPDCSFDTVLCTAVLEHLEEPEEALREAYRVLAPGEVAQSTRHRSTGTATSRHATSIASPSTAWRTCLTRPDSKTS